MWYFKINNVRNGGIAVTAIKKLSVFAVFILLASGLSAKGNVDSETAKTYFEIAQAYAEVSKYDKAAEYYIKAAKDPAHKNAAEYNLARVYGLQGDWNKAKVLLERQHREAPGNVLILKAYAYSLAAAGDEERACSMYKKLYDEDSENPEAALNYARILVFAKRYKEAVDFIEELKTRFTETAEKKVLDELEEKIKKAQEEPADTKKTKKPQSKSGKAEEPAAADTDKKTPPSAVNAEKSPKS